MLDNRKSITFGVIADTHIPDRAKHLPSMVLRAFELAQVDQILHAGDAANWKAIHKLEEIAPVIVVQGNRDWLFAMSFPHHINLTIHNVRITLTHGHRSMLQYLFDKWTYIRIGYRFERYYRHLAADYPDSDVIVFGHTHYQTATWVNEQLFFNPGAAYPCRHNHNRPQFGFLSITPGGIIRTECH
jgi:uncharacterized protein